MRNILQKIESKILTKLFTRWVDGEYDLELLAMTRSLIEGREYEIKYMIDKINHKPINGFSRA